METKHFTKKSAIISSIAILAVIAVLSAMLGGCSKKDTSSDKTSSAQTSSTQTDATQNVGEISVPVWSGNVAENFAAGDGTAENPYQIANAEQLALLGKYINENNEAYNKAHYILTEDIYLNDVSEPDWYEEKNNPKEWTHGIMADWNYLFGGTFNGDFHTVKGIYLSVEEKPEAINNKFMGLFPGLNGGAVIENLGIESSYMKTAYAKENSNKQTVYGCVGAIAGLKRNYPVINNPNTKDITISKCYVADTVIIESVGEAGGFIGRMYDEPYVIMENCYSAAKVVGVPAGAFVGLGKRIKTQNCYNARNDISLIGAGSITPDSTNNYNAGLNSNVESYLDVKEMTGLKASENMKGFDFDTVWEAVDGATPKLRGFN